MSERRVWDVYCISLSLPEGLEGFEAEVACGFCLGGGEKWEEERRGFVLGMAALPLSGDPEGRLL